MLATPPTRPHTFLTLSLISLALAWDASGLDLAVMRALASPDGFPLRNHWLLEVVLHDGAHKLAVALYLGMLLMVRWPLGPLRRLDRLQRVEIVCGLSLNLLLIGGLKVLSHSSCPWDLREFGGLAPYVSHWSWGQGDGGPGHCFPGGHASSAYAWLALAPPWLAGSADEHRRGWVWLRRVMLAGLLLGLAQTLRGAHYPSHTWWTALLCWLGAQTNHWFFIRLRQSRGHRIPCANPQELCD